jgi:hypothetical protein
MQDATELRMRSMSAGRPVDWAGLPLVAALLDLPLDHPDVADELVRLSAPTLLSAPASAREAAS